VTISLADLPFSSSGALEGLWHFRLRDSITTQMATVELQDGRTVKPVNGHLLRRFVVGMGSVTGAVRVEGEPCRIGDVTGLVNDPPAPALEPAPASVQVQSETSAPTRQVEVRQYDHRGKRR
jgi:hypothetical protein